MECDEAEKLATRELKDNQASYLIQIFTPKWSVGWPGWSGVQQKETRAVETSADGGVVLRCKWPVRVP